MQPKPQPPRPKTGPSLPDLKKQKAQADTAAGKQPKPKGKGPAPVLTPEELAKQKAEKAEKEKKEQEKLKAITEKWKKDLTAAEQEEVNLVLNRIAPKTIVNGVVQPCPKNHKALYQYCVPTSQKASFTKELKDAIKVKAAGTGKNAKEIKINYDKLDGWEETHSGAYIPWGPKINKVGHDIGEKDKPHKVTVLVPSTDHQQLDGKPSLKGVPNNRSGVTIGTGVDLGAQDEKLHGAALTKAAKESGLLSEEDTKKLLERLKPYYGLKRTDACQKLRKTPLTLSQAETDLVNLVSLTDYTTNAIKAYEKKTGKKWNDLSEEEQTLMLSHQYHHGHIETELAKSVGEGDKDKVLTELDAKTVGKKKTPKEREYGYMDAYYKRKEAEEKANPKKVKPTLPKSTTAPASTTTPTSTTAPHG